MAKRILYVHNGSDLYGASRSLLRLVTRLDRAKFEPVVILPSEGLLADALRKAGVKVAIMKSLLVISRGVFRSWRIVVFLLLIPISPLVLASFIRRNKIDLVHTNLATVVSTGLAGRLAKVPHVWHIRDSFHEFGFLWRIYSRYVLWLSQKVVCVSKAIAVQFAESEGKVTVVYNGIPLEEFDKVSREEVIAFKKQFGVDGMKTVGVVGRIKFQRKGQDVFAKAVAFLRGKVHKTKYLIVGSPFPGNESHLKRLEELIKDLNIRDEIIFTGDLQKMSVVYKALDILVVPSSTPEPFAGVVLEAMASGTPVIATAIGGTPEQIEDGKSGLLVEPDNPELMAEKIYELLTNRELSNSLREGASKRVEEVFRFERMYSRLEEIYNEVLNSR